MLLILYLFSYLNHFQSYFGISDLPLNEKESKMYDF